MKKLLLLSILFIVSIITLAQKPTVVRNGLLIRMGEDTIYIHKEGTNLEIYATDTTLFSGVWDFGLEGIEIGDTIWMKDHSYITAINDTVLEFGNDFYQAPNDVSTIRIETGNTKPAIRETLTNSKMTWDNINNRWEFKYGSDYLYWDGSIIYTDTDTIATLAAARGLVGGVDTATVIDIIVEVLDTTNFMFEAEYYAELDSIFGIKNNNLAFTLTKNFWTLDTLKFKLGDTYITKGTGGNIRIKSTASPSDYVSILSGGASMGILTSDQHGIYSDGLKWIIATSSNPVNSIYWDGTRFRTTTDTIPDMQWVRENGGGTGTITGTAANTYVTYGTALNTIGYESVFLYNSSTNRLYVPWLELNASTGGSGLRFGGTGPIISGNVNTLKAEGKLRLMDTLYVDYIDAQSGDTLLLVVYGSRDNQVDSVHITIAPGAGKAWKDKRIPYRKFYRKAMRLQALPFPSSDGKEHHGLSTILDKQLLYKIEYELERPYWYINDLYNRVLIFFILFGLTVAGFTIGFISFHKRIKKLEKYNHRHI